MRTMLSEGLHMEYTNDAAIDCLSTTYHAIVNTVHYNNAIKHCSQSL